MFISKNYMRDRIERFSQKNKKYILNYHSRYVRLQGRKTTLRIYYNGIVRISNTKEFKFNEGAVSKYL